MSKNHFKIDPRLSLVLKATKPAADRLVKRCYPLVLFFKEFNILRTFYFKKVFLRFAVNHDYLSVGETNLDVSIFHLSVRMATCILHELLIP